MKRIYFLLSLISILILISSCGPKDPIIQSDLKQRESIHPSGTHAEGPGWPDFDQFNCFIDATGEVRCHEPYKCFEELLAQGYDFDKHRPPLCDVEDEHCPVAQAEAVKYAKDFCSQFEACPDFKLTDRYNKGWCTIEKDDGKKVSTTSCICSLWGRCLPTP